MVYEKAKDGTAAVFYDNGDIVAAVDVTSIQKIPSHSEALLAVASSKLSAQLQITSTGDAVLLSMLEHFNRKSFMRHQAQDFEQYRLVNAYAREEETFLRAARPVHYRDLANRANVMSSHT